MESESSFETSVIKTRYYTAVSLPSSEINVRRAKNLNG